MKHLYAILAKFLLTAIVLGVILTMVTNSRFTDIVFISAVITIIAYLVGDLLILPRSNNIVATIADAGLSIISLMAFDNIYIYADISFGDAVIAAIGIVVGEWIFHKFMARSVLPSEK